MVDTQELLEGIGDRIRLERARAGLSQRELARRLGVSASLISQLESGLSSPSVSTLCSLVNELDLSIDWLVRGSDHVLRESSPCCREDDEPPFHRGKRKAIELESGVRWEQLTPRNREGVDFLLAVYEVGGASTPAETLVRHQGREYGYVISGTLNVQILFEEYQLGPGDAISFDSTIPHRGFNPGPDPASAVWIVVAGSDG